MAEILKGAPERKVSKSHNSLRFLLKIPAVRVKFFSCIVLQMKSIRVLQKFLRAEFWEAVTGYQA